MTTIGSNELLDCAIAAVQSAGDHALANISRRSEVNSQFTHDVKLELDVECQKKAEETILSAFSEHLILGEEDTPSNNRRKASADEYEWIIDPIDGTVNFFHGLPLWCSSIAVRQNGEVLAGAIFAPVLDDLYTATHDRHSQLNGEQIAVSKTKSLSDSIILTGMDKNEESGQKPLARFENIALNTQKARIMGSAALDLCFLATGAADGYFEAGIFIWDIAAGGLIVKQAGGTTEIFDKQDDYSPMEFVASNGLIQGDLLNLVR